MYTAEFVTPKHPDKMCDQISDAILDWALSHDPMSRVAVEVMGGHGKVSIMGEITCSAGYLVEEAAKQIVSRITGQKVEFFEVPDAIVLDVNIVKQSPEIAQGVDTGGAGDQGIMKGYATNETPEYMPKEYAMARALCKYLYERHPYDGKTQVTIDPRGRVTAVVASFQNTDGVVLREEIRAWLMTNEMIKDTSEEEINLIAIHANPAGDWSQGGFDADTGLTGRKLMVDNYGPRMAIGGGAFSGKDATKVDRSAAYMARRIAVDVLEDMKADQVSIEIAYAIGVAHPVAVSARVIKEGTISTIDVTEHYKLTPLDIIDFLDLRKPQFEETAKWGHFGQGFTWK